MTARERAITSVGLLLGIWGSALLSFAMLDHALYTRFLLSILFR